jgi:lipopolysaccharide exporter
MTARLLRSPFRRAGSGEPRSLVQQARGGAAWSVLANLTMRFASIAVTAVLARLLSKSDFGAFAIALAVYLVVASLAELGMASAIARSAEEPEDIAPTVASLSLLVSGGVAIAMAVLATPLATVLGQPSAAPSIRILSLCLFLTGVFAVPGAQLVREFRQGSIFAATVVGFLVANPLLIVLALHGGGATAFAWSRVVGQLATGLVLVLACSRRYRPGWRSDQVRPLLLFGLPLAMANLVNWTLLNADYLILGRLVDTARVGVYMIAFNVASWSTAILGSVLNSVVVPSFARLSADRERLGSALVSSAQLVAVIALPVGAITCALASPLVATVFGPTWSDSAPVLAVLAWYGVLFSYSLLFSNVLVALGKTGRLLVVQGVWVAFLVPSIVLGLRHAGLPGVGWAHVVTIAAIAVPAYLVAALRATGVSLGRLLRPALRPFLAALAAGGAAWGLAHAFSSSFLQLLAGGMLGCAVYALLVAPVVLSLVPPERVPSWVPRARRRTEDPAADQEVARL